MLLPRLILSPKLDTGDITKEVLAKSRALCFKLRLPILVDCKEDLPEKHCLKGAQTFAFSVPRSRFSDVATRNGLGVRPCVSKIGLELTVCAMIYGYKRHGACTKRKMNAQSSCIASFPYIYIRQRSVPGSTSLWLIMVSVSTIARCTLTPKFVKDHFVQMSCAYC